MYDQLFFRDKGLFLQRLHPVTALTYLAVLLVLAMMFNNPLYLLGLLAVIILTIWAVDGLPSWETYIRISLGMMVLIMVINPLIVRAGETIIWWGPSIPFFGRLTISLEAICYGAAMSVKLLNIISLFCLYQLMIHPDKVVGVFSRFASRSALVLSLATRMFPTMVRRWESIREVQVLRGVDFQAGTWKERLQKYSSLIQVLLTSSLEDAFETAEAMQARAFGSGRRSTYRRDAWRPRDFFCLAGSLMALSMAIYGEVEGYSSFNYYPELEFLLPDPLTFVLLVFILGSLSIPMILSWGWQRWLYFKLKV